jgi:hypothetical protein
MLRAISQDSWIFMVTHAEVVVSWLKFNMALSAAIACPYTACHHTMCIFILVHSTEQQSPRHASSPRQ